MCAAVDLCSSRHCNICLLLDADQPTTDNTKKLSKCNGCKLVYYCGSAHQREEWPLHRRFCKAASHIMRTFNVAHPYLLTGQPSNAAELERVTLQVKYLLAKHMARSLEWHEQELTSFPAHCAVCYRFEQLQHCRQCGGVSYCSEAHRAAHAQQHSLHCYLLQLYYCPYKVRVQTPMTAATTAIGKLKRGVPSLQRIDLVAAIEYATERSVPTKPHATLQAYQQFAAAADYSYVATICYALAHVDAQPRRSAEFIIFVVGATMEHQLYFQPHHVRLFFLQNAHITRLQLHFIGPEVCETASGTHECAFELHGVRRHVAYSMHKMLVQQFSSKCRVQPSLVIAFNCGFAEYTQDGKSNAQDTWRAGLAQMLTMRHTPIVFTSYTKLEAEFDFAALMRVVRPSIEHSADARVQRILDAHHNPYRDLRPLRNWQLTYSAGGDMLTEEHIYYRNGFVQAVRPQL